MKYLTIVLFISLFVFPYRKQGAGGSAKKKIEAGRKEAAANEIPGIVPDSTYRININILSDSAGNTYWLSDEYCRGTRQYHLNKYAPYGSLLWKKKISEAGDTTHTVTPCRFKVDAAGNVCIYSEMRDTQAHSYRIYRFNNSGESSYSDSVNLYSADTNLRSRVMME